MTTDTNPFSDRLDLVEKNLRALLPGYKSGTVPTFVAMELYQSVAGFLARYNVIQERQINDAEYDINCFPFEVQNLTDELSRMLQSWHGSNFVPLRQLTN